LLPFSGSLPFTTLITANLTTTDIPFGLQLKEINLEMINLNYPRSKGFRVYGFRQVEWRGGSASIARGLEK
jgi:hypothetical protein